jgi:hypothetical protein
MGCFEPTSGRPKPLNGTLVDCAGDRSCSAKIQHFRTIAEARARARLLGLAGEYEQLADALAGPEPRRP